MIGWIDLETTGLDPNKNRILEVGAVVTNDFLVIEDIMHVVIHFKDKESVESDFVKKMHEDNRLWEDCSASSVSLYEAEDLLLGFFNKRLKQNESPLAGSSVHFDRSFLKVHMPQLEAFFSYRNIDVSSIKEVVKRWYPEIYNKWNDSPHEPSHRAHVDIIESIEELRFYRGRVFV